MLAIIASLKKMTFCMKLPQEILVPIHHVEGKFVVAQFYIILLIVNLKPTK